MKGLIYYTILMMILLSSQDKKIIGKFNMKFEHQFEYQNGVIEFCDSVYFRLLPNGKTIKGKIQKEESNVVLRDNDSDFEMLFLLKKWGGDNLYFATRTKKNDNLKEGQMIIYSGKLTKIK